MKIILYSLLLVIILSQSLFGQKIYLNNAIYSSYTYSIDSVNFKPIDVYDIEQIMGDDPEALSLLNNHKVNLTISKVLSYPAGFMIGWAIGNYISTGVFESSSSSLLLVGGGLAVFAIIFERVAHNYLKNAVSLYNYHNNSQISMDFRYNNKTNELNFLFKYSF